MYGNQYMSYHFEDVKNKYGKVVEKRIVQNERTLVLLVPKSSRYREGSEGNAKGAYS